jgi:hypothetical protein
MAYTIVGIGLNILGKIGNWLLKLGEKHGFITKWLYICYNWKL